MALIVLAFLTSSCSADMKNAKVCWNDKGHLVEFDKKGIYEILLIINDQNRQDFKFKYQGDQISLEEAMEIPGFLLGEDKAEKSFIGYAYESELEIGEGAKKIRFADRTSVYLSGHDKLLAIVMHPSSESIRKKDWGFTIERRGVDLKKKSKDYFLELLGQPLETRRFFNKLAQ